ncbi:hypothetical protein JCM10207_008735 [Rhodosporidiobolus poonsookiae]
MEGGVMLSPEPSSPPPRRRRRRAPRKKAPPAQAPDPPLHLAEAFHGLAPVREAPKGVQGAQKSPGEGKARSGEPGETRDAAQQRDEEEQARFRTTASSSMAATTSDPLPSPALRRPSSPLKRALVVDSTSSDSSLATPPPAQLAPVTLSSSLTPLPSDDGYAAAGPAQQPQPQPISPASRLRTGAGTSTGRRNSVHGKVPDPLWAARVLSPIVRAEAAAQERAQGGKGKGQRGVGWRTLSEGSDSRNVGIPLSADEFLVNVLPRTKSARGAETLQKRKKKREERKKKREERKAGKKGDRDAKAKRTRQRAPTTTPSAEEEEEGEDDLYELFDPAEIDFRAAGPSRATPKALHRASTFLGALELDQLGSKGRDRLLRKAPYAPPGTRHELEFDRASRTPFGREGGEGEGALPGPAGKKKRGKKPGRHDEDDEAAGSAGENGAPVKRLKPGKDVRAPFLDGIERTAFTPLLNVLDAAGKRRRQDVELRRMGELEDDVERVADEAVGAPTRAQGKGEGKKRAVLKRAGGGRLKTLALGGAEEEDALGRVEPRLVPTAPSRKAKQVARKPASDGFKFRFIPRRLPPPRRLNPQAAPVEHVEPPAAAFDRAVVPAASSPQLEKAMLPDADLRSPAPVKRRQPDFRFVTGAKAKKAPTIEVRSALTLGGTSAASTSQVLRFDTPQPAQAQARHVHPTSSASTSVSTKKRTALVTPGAHLARGESQSDPEPDPPRKKRLLLRRLSTRPTFKLPAAIEEEVDLGTGRSGGGRAHPSSHEYSARARSRSRSLPPDLDQAYTHAHATSPSDRLAPAPRISPELFAPAAAAALPSPAAGQTRSSPPLAASRAPSAGSYFADESPSFAAQAEQAARAFEALVDAGGGAFLPVRGERVAPLSLSSSEGHAQRSSLAVPSTNGRRLPPRRRLSSTSLASLASLASSPLLSRVPSLRPAAAYSSVEPEPVRGSAFWHAEAGTPSGAVEGLEEEPDPDEGEDEVEMEETEVEPPASAFSELEKEVDGTELG